MRKFILFVICVFALTFNLEASVFLTQFAVQPSFLQEGKIKPKFGAETPFTVNFAMIKSGETYNRVRVVVIYRETSGVEIEISGSEYMFPGNWTPFPWEAQLSAKLPAGKTTGKVYLKYKTWDYDVEGGFYYSSGSYSIYSEPVNPNPGTPLLNPGPPPVPGAVPIFLLVNGGGLKRFLSLKQNDQTGYVPHSCIGFVFKSPTTGTVPLHHYLAQNGNNYYTITPGSYGGYTYQGVFCYVYDNQVSKSLPVYSHFNGPNGIHHYKSAPGILPGWNFEDVKFYTLHNSQRSPHPLPEEDCAEFYQYLDPNTSDHFYTTENDISGGYHKEKVLGYISTIQKPGTVPLYRYFNKTSDHYYTIVKKDYNSYVYEGIAGYVYDTPSYPGTVPVYSYFTLSTGDHYYNTLNSNFDGYVNEGIKFYMLQYNH